LGQNGTESGFHGSAYVETKEQTAPGLQVAPKASTIICSTDVRHVKLHHGLRNAMPSFRHDSTVTCIPGNGGV